MRSISSESASTFEKLEFEASQSVAEDGMSVSIGFEVQSLELCI